MKVRLHKKLCTTPSAKERAKARVYHRCHELKLKMGAKPQSEKNKNTRDDDLLGLSPDEIVLYVSKALKENKKRQIYKQNFGLPQEVLMDIFKSLGKPITHKLHFAVFFYQY